MLNGLKMTRERVLLMCSVSGLEWRDVFHEKKWRTVVMTGLIMKIFKCKYHFVTTPTNVTLTKKRARTLTHQMWLFVK